MRTLRLCLALSLVALFIAAASPALGLANRVFVSQRSGNDANSCDNILTPCQTFAGAVLQLNPGGEAIVLDSGGYGTVTITQAVTIEAPPGVLAFIHPPSGDAITINAGASDTVILRGLTLNGGTGNGITANTVGQLLVEHCTITGYGNDGVHFVADGGTLFMRDDNVQKCSLSGVLVTTSGTGIKAVISDSSFVDNYRGVRGSNGSTVIVTHCVASGNAGYGFISDSTPGSFATMTLERVQAVQNGTGLGAFAEGGSTTILFFASSLVSQNLTGTDNGGTGIIHGSSPGTSLVFSNGVESSGGLGLAIALQ
jgi:hypothetical protein